jgi:hypothetical protein
MKCLLAAVVVAAACSVSAAAFAQSNGPDNSVQTQAGLAQSGSNGDVVRAGNDSHDKYETTRHHRGRYDPDPNCVGPVSFCSVYFGS